MPRFFTVIALAAIVAFSTLTLAACTTPVSTPTADPLATEVLFATPEPSMSPAPLPTNAQSTETPPPTPEPGQTAAYIAMLKNLSPEPGRIVEAVTMLQSLPTPDDNATDALLAFLREITDVLYNPEEAVFVDTYLRPYQSEGDTYAEVDMAALHTILAGHLTPAYDAYFQLESDLSARHLGMLYKDAALFVNWNQLAEAVILKYDYCAAWPGFTKTYAVEDAVNDDFAYYLGYQTMDNLITYDPATLRLREDVADSYKTFIAAYPDHPLTPRVLDMLTAWQKEGQRNEAIQAYWNREAQNPVFAAP